VSTAEFDVSPSSTGITIYDDTTPRPTVAPGWNTADFAYASTQWGSDASTLYVSEQAFPTDFYSLAVTASGVSVTKDYPGALTFSFSDFGIHFDAGTGLIYTDGGQVVNPATAAVVGNFNASGIAIPDSTLGRVYFIGQTTAQAGTTSFTIQAFDQQKFTLLDSIVVSNVIGVPTAVIRWGVNGLAFTTRVGAVADFYDIGPGQLYVVSGQFVKPASTNIKKLGALFSEHVHNSWASSKGLNGPTLPAPHRFRESDR
jgi:hypothetical protein